MNASWGAMLNHMRSLRVSQAGTECVQIFTPHFAIIAPESYGGSSKGIMDDSGQHGYRFDNADMTESCRVEMGPLPLLVDGAWGKEPN
jgi:hypothetical protein